MTAQIITNTDWFKDARLAKSPNVGTLAQESNGKKLTEAFKAFDRVINKDAKTRVEALKKLDAAANTLAKQLSADKVLASFISELRKAIEEEVAEIAELANPAMLTTDLAKVLKSVPKAPAPLYGVVAVGEKCAVLVTRRKVSKSAASGPLLAYLGVKQAKFVQAQVLFEEKATTFVVEGAGGTLARKINAAVKAQTGLTLKVRVRDEAGEIDEDLADQSLPEQGGALTKSSTAAGVKRALQKVFLSNEDNYDIRRAKVQSALDELERAIREPLAHALGEEVSKEDALRVEAFKNVLQKTDVKAKSKEAGKAFEALEPLKERVREALVEARQRVAQAKALLAKVAGEKDAKKRWVLCEKLIADLGDRSPVSAELEDILAEAKREWGVGQAKAAYAAQIKGQKHVGDADTPAYNPGGKHNLVNTDDKVKVLDPVKVKQLMAKHKLEEGEVLAIRAYTGANYKFINPAVANQKDNEDKPTDWMDKNRPKTGADKQKNFDTGGVSDKGSKKSYYEEGSLHAGMVMAALKKLPVKKGTVYRGSRCTEADFAKRYKVGDISTYEAFASTSTSRAVARHFANGAGMGAPVPNDQRWVSVYEEAEIEDARDVMDFSIFASENEWLVLPGTKLKVVDIVDDPDGEQPEDMSIVRARKWKKIIMRSLTPDELLKEQEKLTVKGKK